MINKRVIPYRPGHIDFLNPLDCYAEDAAQRVEDQCMHHNHAVYTLVVGNKPIAVVGCTEATRGVLSVWALAGKEVKDFPLFYHKAIKQLINGHVEELGARRVQSLIARDNDLALKQHISLGFEIEAELKCSGPTGEDQYLLRKLING